MCVNCLRTQVDISEGIQKQATILWCKNCARYLQPPKHWLHAEPESKELLTFCLKKLKGLQKVPVKISKVFYILDDFPNLVSFMPSAHIAQLSLLK